MLILNNRRLVLLAFIVTIVMCMPIPVFAAFESLTTSGGEIFEGLRSIIYPASAIGIITICIGGFFGNVNWKWLFAIVVGLVVISCCVAFVSMFMPEDAASKIPGDVMTGA